MWWWCFEYFECNRREECRRHGTCSRFVTFPLIYPNDRIENDLTSESVRVLASFLPTKFTCLQKLILHGESRFEVNNYLDNQIGDSSLTILNDVVKYRITEKKQVFNFLDISSSIDTIWWDCRLWNYNRRSANPSPNNSKDVWDDGCPISRYGWWNCVQCR